jgi:hypothetical protein
MHGSATLPSAFPKVEPLLREAGAQRMGLAGQAHGRLVDARALRDRSVPSIAVREEEPCHGYRTQSIC